MAAPLVCLALLTGCDGGPPPAPLPEVAVNDLAEPAQRQIEAAYATARAQPDAAAATGRLGMILQAYTRNDAAEQLYRRARELDPDAFQWAYYHGYLLNELGSTQEALAALRRASELAPDNPYVTLRLAQRLLDDGDAEAAAAAFRRVVDHHADMPAAHVGLGRALVAGGDAAAARTHFETAIALSPRDAGAHYGLAGVLRQLGDTDGAAQHMARFDEFKKISQLNYDPLLAKIGELNLSEQPHLQRARHHVARGEVRDAIEDFEHALEANPSNASAIATLVGLYASVGDFESSDRLYETGRSISPNNAKLHFNHGLSMQFRRRFDESVAAFERSLEIAARDPHTRAYLGVSLAGAGREAEALEQFRAALAINPDHRLANFRLGQALIEQGAAADAIAPLTKAAARDDRASIDYLVVLADAHRAAGDRPASRATLERALGLARSLDDPRAGQIESALAAAAGS